MMYLYASTNAKMNIELFREHNASRKIQCAPLEVKKVPVKFPPHYATVEPSLGKLVFTDECTVKRVDLESNTQYVVLSLSKELKNWILSVDDTPRDDIRLSRFKYAFGGSENLSIRIWKDGERVDDVLESGCTVRCAFQMRNSKGNMYFDLHRDIELVTAGAKRRKVVYLSDGDSD